MIYKDVMGKMVSTIETSPPEHKEVVERYLSLANRWLRDEWENGADKGNWGILGGSMAIKSRFEAKFGIFRVRDRAIIDGVL